MEFELTQGLAVLERTPKVMDAMLRGLPDAWVKANEGVDTWSPYDIVGHLIHGEKTDWMPRARIILEHGEKRTFETYDRFAQYRESKGKSLEALLDEFAGLRAANLETLRSWKLTPSQLALRGIHPELGPVTLAQLLATWVAHDLDHVFQVSRVMAKQYGEAVGPWSVYLKAVRSS